MATAVAPVSAFEPWTLKAPIVLAPPCRLTPNVFAASAQRGTSPNSTTAATSDSPQKVAAMCTSRILIMCSSTDDSQFGPLVEEFKNFAACSSYPAATASAGSAGASASSPARSPSASATDAAAVAADPTLRKAFIKVLQWRRHAPAVEMQQMLMALTLGVELDTDDMFMLMSIAVRSRCAAVVEALMERAAGTRQQPPFYMLALRYATTIAAPVNLPLALRVSDELTRLGFGWVSPRMLFFLAGFARLETVPVRAAARLVEMRTSKLAPGEQVESFLLHEALGALERVTGPDVRIVLDLLKGRESLFDSTIGPAVPTVQRGSCPCTDRSLRCFLVDPCSVDLMQLAPPPPGTCFIFPFTLVRRMCAEAGRFSSHSGVTVGVSPGGANSGGSGGSNPSSAPATPHLVRMLTTPNLFPPPSGAPNGPELSAAAAQKVATLRMLFDTYPDSFVVIPLESELAVRLPTEVDAHLPPPPHLPPCSRAIGRLVHFVDCCFAHCNDLTGRQKPPTVLVGPRPELLEEFRAMKARYPALRVATSLSDE